MDPFFIYSLPRSGTAWLSVFLTAFDSYCYHEPLADMDADQLAARIANRPDWTVGAIDTSAHTYGAGYIKKAVPRARCFVLRRSVVDIQASTDRFGVHYDAATAMGELLNITHGMPVIDHARFSDVWYLRDLWSELIGGSFDRERAEMFVEMNIQRDPNRFFGTRPHLMAGYNRVREIPCH